MTTRTSIWGFPRINRTRFSRLLDPKRLKKADWPFSVLSASLYLWDRKSPRFLWSATFAGVGRFTNLNLMAAQWRVGGGERYGIDIP
jgi:hypothetical protein